MARENSEVATINEFDKAEGADGLNLQEDLSRQAWDEMRSGSRGDRAAAADAAEKDSNERGGVIARDAQGRITRVDYPDGVTYEYGKFDANGQPTRIKITDHKSGDFGQWNKEGEGLWRSYNKDKPNYEVLVGEWRVDEQGIMRMDGRQDSRPLPGKDTKGYTEQPSSKVTRDGDGRISQVEYANGVKYQYSDFDESGQPMRVKITRRGDRDYGEWIKEKDGLWRAHHNGRPTSEVIVGEWRVNEKGEMRLDGRQDMQPVAGSEASSSRRRDTAGSGDRQTEPRTRSQEKPVELTTETFPDGHALKRRPDGKLAEIHYPPGPGGKSQSRSLRYDDKGELSEIRESDGSRWRKTSDGKWSVRLPDGTKGATWDSVTVDENGNLAYEQTSSQFKFTKDADGTSTMASGRDGTLVKFDSKDRPIESTNKSGTRKFEYDEKNNLVAVTHADGTKFVKDGPNSWKEYGKDGKETGKVWKGRVDSDLIGGITYKEEGQTDSVNELASGEKFIEKANGVSVLFDADGSRTAVFTPEGRKLAFGADDQASYQVKSGDTLSRIARDLLIAKNTTDIGYQPTRQEVAAAVEALVQANGIADRNVIVKGQALKIPRELAN